MQGSSQRGNDEDLGDLNNAFSPGALRQKHTGRTKRKGIGGGQTKRGGICPTRHRKAGPGSLKYELEVFGA